ncbi:uncharacterized protein LOC131663863 [Phymastichus coffea]|uniref:uncharacterized protein LOC131663863 n=1 Tax=Phymastichus coffea TaxID=108790 RepID=UPI00273B6FD0|nr:uncharacterized protein LOC131663863 [Phymastichus coffea]
MNASVAAVESLGFDHIPQCWEQESMDFRPRNSLNSRQRRDRMQEFCQYLECKLRECKKEMTRLKKENDALKETNDALKEANDTLKESYATLKKNSKEYSRGMLSLAPAALNETKDSSLRYAGFMLAKFDGTNPTNFAEYWLKMICDIAAFYNWSERQTFFAAKMALDGEARQWLVGLRRDINTFSDFKVEFTEKYQKKHMSIARVHLELAKRKKLEGEALDDYLTDMKNLAEKINLNEALTMEYVVLGLDDDVRSKLMLDQFTTLAEMEKYLIEHVDEFRLPAEGIDTNAKKCYHCNKVGHVYSECEEVIKSNISALFIVAVLLAIMGV